MKITGDSVLSFAGDRCARKNAQHPSFLFFPLGGRSSCLPDEFGDFRLLRNADGVTARHFRTSSSTRKRQRAKSGFYLRICLQENNIA